MTIVAILGSLVALLAISIGLIWIFQERIAFQPPRPPFPEINPESGRLKRVSYRATDGQPLLAYIVGDPNASSGLLLCFHGNADLAIWSIEWAEELSRRTGFTVMLAEYRGYMGLPGHPTYLASQLDSEAAYAYARQSLAVPPDHIAFYGHSLGTAVAAELAARHRPAALILESPFTSARAMGRIIGWGLVELGWNAIARLHFDTVARVASIDAPVWVAHGVSDRLIPVEMGRQVFAAAKVKGQLLLVPNASHNDVPAQAGDEYWHWIETALGYEKRQGSISSPAVGEDFNPDSIG